MKSERRLRGTGRRYTTFGSLLEGVPQLDQSRLAASHACEAHPKGPRIRVEPRWKGIFRHVRRRTERYDHCWIAGFGGYGGAIGRWKQDGVEPLRLHYLVDTVCP